MRMTTERTQASDERQQALYELADRQAGYFTASQARTAGYSDRLQHHHHQRGHWLEHGWGLYRLRDYPITDEEELTRLSLWSRTKTGEPQAVISHETALELYELTDLMPNRKHLSVPKSFRKKPPIGVILHKANLKPNDWTWRGSYRITTPLRTLIDVAAAHISPEHLEVALEQVLERGLVRKKNLEAVIATMPEQSPLVRSFRAVCNELEQRATATRNAESRDAVTRDTATQTAATRNADTGRP